ncbi:hypothetical protein BGZ98_000789 [Dissophora globulifera]|nr:hypothetical protein BGZ98_000789 [Dissophora globulifera]
MSNYNRNYSNSNNNGSNNNGHYDAQPSSSLYHQGREEDYHPLQQQQSQQQLEYGEDPAAKAKKRMVNPAKAVAGGISHGTHAVAGGVVYGANAVRGGISNVEKGVSAVGTKLNTVPVVSHGVSFFSDYRKFMDRGNVMDLAVAVVIGAAFTAIVTSLVNDIITPVIALASGKNLDENFIILRHTTNATAAALGPPATRQQAKDAGNITWNWGNFVQTVINFFIISGCIFLLVKAYQMARNNKAAVTEKKCDYCLKGAPLNAVRCPTCTTWLDWDAYTKVANLKRAAGGQKVESPFMDPSGH